MGGLGSFGGLGGMGMNRQAIGQILSNPMYMDPDGFKYPQGETNDPK